jgi:purine-binding chemotaxis protein CheW
VSEPRLAPESKAEEPLEEDQAVQLCAFRVGAEKYAVDLQRVDEIIQPPQLTWVPNAPPFVEGVIHVRDHIIPVIDLRKRLGLPRSPPALRPKCMICRVGREWVAILVDGTSEVLRVAISDLRPVPRLLFSPARPYVIGVCGAPDDLTLLLDLKALFAPDGRPGDPR